MDADWTHAAGGAWRPPAASPQLAGLTLLQFMALFTEGERAAIVASSDPQAKLFVVTASGAGTIDLTNSEVIPGVECLASAGLLAAAEATRVLTEQSPA
ncbi:MAG: hypothetical protein ABSC22_03845 [Roseiarcus sp.]